jgi:hypothetical protein
MIETSVPGTVKKVRRGSWNSNPIFKPVVESQFFPVDVMVMNFYDSLVPGRKKAGLSFWQMMVVDEAFYLVPEDKDPSVQVVSPNGYRAELSSDVAGIVATLFALGHMGNHQANVAFRRLLKHAQTLTEYAHIARLID